MIAMITDVATAGTTRLGKSANRSVLRTSPKVDVPPSEPSANTKNTNRPRTRYSVPRICARRISDLVATVACGAGAAEAVMSPNPS